MTNWKLMETSVYAILGVVAISLLSPEGFMIIPGLTEKVFGFVEWKTLLAALLGWAIYAHRQMVRV